MMLTLVVVIDFAEAADNFGDGVEFRFGYRHRRQRTGAYAVWPKTAPTRLTTPSVCRRRRVSITVVS